jgi:RimJ/RimL family protein N-acetyltransferase
MRYLGGPVTLDQIQRAHERRAADNSDRWLKIVLEPGDDPVGVIGIWQSEHSGGTIHETGWMVSADQTGRGIATRALALLLDIARSDPEIETLHAFPNVANEPSNALCRRAGFELLGEEELAFRDRPVRCNHWLIRVG